MVSRPDERVQILHAQTLVEIDKLEVGALIRQVTPGLATARSTGLVIEADRGH